MKTDRQTVSQASDRRRTIMSVAHHERTCNVCRPARKAWTTTMYAYRPPAANTLELTHACDSLTVPRTCPGRPSSSPRGGPPASPLLLSLGAPTLVSLSLAWGPSLLARGARVGIRYSLLIAHFELDPFQGTSLGWKTWLQRVRPQTHLHNPLDAPRCPPRESA